MADNNQSETPANGSDYKKYITYALIALAAIIIIWGLWYLLYNSSSGLSIGNAPGSLSDVSPSGLLKNEKAATLADTQPHDSNVSFLNRDDALKGLDTAFKH